MVPFFRCLFVLVFSCSAARAQVKTTLRVDSLPESVIDIPIRLNLRPVFALAERNVDTVFTSPNYPNDWVQADCATRYKYRFRRSPLQMSMNGNTLLLGFLGYYQIIGSSRACVNGTVLSPWTPACRCGFEEQERRVQVGFSASFVLQPNYLLNTQITRNEPQAMDKCSVCFWGQDVTTSVLNGLKTELDASKKAMEDSFGRYNLKPYLQRAWNLMSATYQIPGIGFFNLHPKKLRMDQLNARNNLLNINIGISAAPVVSFSKPAETVSVIPNLSSASAGNGFNIHLEALLEYDSLSKVMNGFAAGKTFDVADGLFKKTVVIKEAKVLAGDSGSLQVQVDFTGSFNGSLRLNGHPVYNAEKKRIEIENLEYDLQSKNLLLKTAKWLFNKKILAELNKYASFELSDYYLQATATLNDWLNREWAKGIRGAGAVSDLKLTALHALPEHLLIRSNCTGKLEVLITEMDFKF